MHARTTSQIVAAVPNRTVAGPCCEQHVTKAHAIVVGNGQSAPIVTTDDQCTGQVTGPSKHTLCDRKPFAIGGDDQRIAVLDAGNQCLQNGV